jgi:hypothetical protein
MVMGVTPQELSKHYPCIYHMAHRDSWTGIQRHGLLCTEALLELFEVSAEERASILNQQRRKCFSIKHATHGTAVVRDQKPLIRSRLEPKLKDCSFQQWLTMLNSRVFFWLSTARLQTLMCAAEYCADQHVVLVLNTLRLATDFQQSITLAPMNTGNTRPIAHARGLSTFSRMVDYPFEERRQKRLELIMELAVEGGVRNIMDYVTEAAEMRCSTCDKKKGQAIRTVRRLYP